MSSRVCLIIYDLPVYITHYKSGLLVIPGVFCLWVLPCHVLPWCVIKYYHLSLYLCLRVPVPPSCAHRDSNTQFSGNVAFYVDFHEGVEKSWPNGEIVGLVIKGCESRAGRNCRCEEWMYSALSALNITTEVPLSKAPNPQLHKWLLRVCVHGVCVFTAVCVHFGWINAEHEFWVWVTILGCMSRHFHFHFHEVILKFIYISSWIFFKVENVSTSRIAPIRWTVETNVHHYSFQ